MNATTKSIRFKVSEADVRHLLEQGRHRYWRQMNAPLIRHLLGELAAWAVPPEPDPYWNWSPEGQKARWLVRFLAHAVTAGRERIAGLERRNAEFLRRYERCISKDEREHQILEYARDLGAGPARLAGDGRALRRWFDHHAVGDRYRKILNETERALSFRLDCLGETAAFLLRIDGGAIGHARLWKRLDLEMVLSPLFRYEGDPRVATAAFRALSTSLRSIPQHLQDASIERGNLIFLFQTVLDAERDIWLQCEAFALLRSLASQSFLIALKKRLAYPRPGDDLFVRRRALLLLGERLDRSELEALLPQAIQDPSPYVRQALSELLVKADADTAANWLPELAHWDQAPEVRGAALLSLVDQLAKDRARLPWVLDCLVGALREERHIWVLRTGLWVAGTAAAGLENAVLERWCDALRPVLADLHRAAPSLAVRRWAAQTRERLWSEADPEARQLKAELSEFLDSVGQGRTRRLPRALERHEDTLLGRVLAVLAQEDFGYDLERRGRRSHLTRGHVFGFRFWRLLHEWRHPSPEKRQAFSHTCGRLFFGNLRASAARLAELAETRVPGEPLHMSSEDGWRPYLPLVDEVLSCLNQGQTVRIFTSEGITELRPPRNPLYRRFAHWRISCRVAELSRLRNYREGDQGKPEDYLAALRRFGLMVAYRPYGAPAESEDPAVRRFFPLLWTIPSWNDLWRDWREYFISVYGNSIYDLTLCLTVTAAYFVGKHIVLFRRLRRARARLPLVVGGWGTRGKSGTERLKAALFNALGYGIVSKTTGCEAMFLHAYPFGTLREMFLFRPYDKATIWEQHNLLLFSETLGCEVFLWECMALTPAYVLLLQRQWMRDDIATLTNAYPDHEDIQGPAGINIPEVMTRFIPERGTLLTTEEQMLPLFKEEARRVGTQLRAAGWREAGLLATDVLARFPYDEHPYNIALVLALAHELQVPEDFALKEMADRVIADLGVLKTFPAAPWRTRRLEFINGMSANERFGCLGNWQRVGLAESDYERDSGTWVTVVVNNRADRVARSRVFASVVVKDIECDCLVLIGNNLNGLLSYIKEAWQEWTADLGIDAKRDGVTSGELQNLARRLRVPYRAELVQARLKAMLGGQGLGAAETPALLELWKDPQRLAERLRAKDAPCVDEIIAFLARDLKHLEEYWALLQSSPEAAAGQEATAGRLQTILWQWFESKIVVVWDYYADGDKVIEHICDACPPGHYNRILGVQNIKGTGLDFVYRWQSWEQCHRACRLLGSDDSAQFAQGLRELEQFSDYGVLCGETVRAVVSRVKGSPLAQQERFQAGLNRILETLERSLEELHERMDTVPTHGWLKKVSDAIEAVLDASDAVNRRKQANRIYRDLADQRISHERAALELKALNKRQKGHWLYETISRLLTG